MKGKLCICLLCILSAPLFSSGVMTGLHHKRVIQTQYFDIIYASGSEKSATLIANNIDSMYESLFTQFRAKPWSHFPVTITSSLDELNAYFTSFPYNRIVLFDTLPEESLAVYSNTLLSVLYHEMTHAVNYNQKNNAWSLIGTIFGDQYSPAFLNVPSSVSEGTAVTMESAVTEKEGRVNSAFSTHVVRQAKIDGVFPPWQSITGARDIYPVGELPYIFGGMFFTYLKNTYGQEKLTQYWYRMNNEVLGAFYFQPFEEIFGISLKQAWNDWYNTISVPDVPSDPLKTDGIEPFLQDKNIKTQPDSHLYYSLTGSSVSGAKYIAWINNNDSSVWICDANTRETKVKKLFTLSGISSVSLSADGKYLAVCCTDNSSKKKAGVYTLKTGKFTFAKDTGLRSPSIVRDSDGKPYLCAVYTKSQNAAIRIYEIVEKKSSVSIVRSPAKEIQFNVPVSAAEVQTYMPFSLTDGGQGLLSFICKKGMNFYLRVYDLKTDESSDYMLPEPYRNTMQIQFLSGVHADSFTGGQEGVLLSFSYTLPDSLPRLGFFSLTGANPAGTASWYLQKSDVSGGVYYPVAFPRSESVKLPDVVYSARFYDHKELYRTVSDKIDFEKFNALSAADVAADAPDVAILPSAVIVPESKDYSPFAYFTDGIFLPFGETPVYNTDFDTGTQTLLGLTYLTSNPWGGTIISFSGGYNVSESLGGGTLSISGTGSGTAKYSLAGSAIFDSCGLYQATGIGSASTSIQSGTHSKIIFSDIARIFNGHSFDSDNTELAKSYKWISMDNNAEITFSTVRQIGSGYYSYGGVFAGPFVKSEYHECTTVDSTHSYNNLGLTAGFSLPQLLPIKNPSGYTVNFPEESTFTLFPKAGLFFEDEAAVVLFSTEIQKGTETFFLPFYIQRVSFRGLYSGECKYADYDSWEFTKTADLTNDFVNGKMDYYDKIGLAADLYFSFNTGVFSSMPVRLSFSVEYAVRPEPDKKRLKGSITGKIIGL